MGSEQDRGLNRRQLLAGLGGAAASATALHSQAQSATSVARWDLTTDVLIAGSGSAGACAAIAARDSGAEAIVLEALPKPGGSSAMSGGVIYAGGGTALQQALRIDDSPEAMYDFLVSAGGPGQQLDKIQLYCEQSPEHFSWITAQGVPYTDKLTTAKGLPIGEESLYFSGNELAWPARGEARPAPRGHVPGTPGMTGGRTLMEHLLKAVEQRGVRTMTATRGIRLIRESDGRIAGMVVEQQGESLYLRARRGVVLACGGFIHNKDMLQMYAPELAACSVPWGNAGDQGDGINMGISVGAAAVHLHRGFAIAPIYPPEQTISGIVLNRQAQRFVAEDSYHGVIGDHIAYHQGGEAFLLCDSDSDFEDVLDNFPVVASASSLGELASLAGLPSGALQHTVAYYNRHAANGDDPLFSKARQFLRPIQGRPYTLYDLSVKRAFFPVHTFGGLRTGVDAEVYDAWGQVIPGLFAAGRTTAGLPTSPYIASGLSVGDCTFFGRRAGATAAGLTT